ncbi:cupredoxin domain-containing protein [Neobacillus sp. PS3-40]|uniref:cupredoxin domain-containing protein n=1 Tax=Neobacillus sp. PS3-40 TaxID=3070679 RepID=UPI0027DF4DFF|nr:cupredoxin domain-containing protein [Neobacillus sp. PS3-40]WML42673.1 cupredoxin domain-containing protein [Neobacillus sp. PS3-40]
MMKRLVVLVIASVLMVLMLSACGSNTKQTDNSSTATTTATKGDVVEIKVTAKDFEFDKKVIHVKKGDKVKITLQSDDGGHGLAIPDYNIDIQGNGSAEFTADKAGTFEYHCSLMCGAGHAKMTGKLIVE